MCWRLPASEAPESLRVARVASEAANRARELQYLPSNLGGVLTGSTSGLAHPLAPWTGFGVLCGYAVVLGQAVQVVR